MAMQLDSVVPFGRSLDEYVRMFNLTPTELKGRLLGVGDGPASFNAEATQQGVNVISIDPIYQFSSQEIKQRFDQVVDHIIDQVRATPDDWVWSYHKSPDDLRQNRVNVLQTFITDYDNGKEQGRYQIGALPILDFPNQSFDLALCSHLLFLYSEHYDLQFHLAAIEEMLRVSREVRIFPLLTLMLDRSPHLQPILDYLSSKGYLVSIQTVQYELQRGGNEMLRIQHYSGTIS